MKAFQHGALDWSTSVSAIFFNHSNNVVERTANEKHSVFWGGDEKRDTAVYIGAVVVDHPQLDKFTAFPGAVFMCKNML